MALSGSIDFNQTRNTIINDALVLCGVIEAGASPLASATAGAARQLNRMLKSWMADGIQLWRQDECVLHLAAGTASYSIGTGGSHATTDADAVKTELASAGSASDTSLTVDSISGISNGDNIGIVLDDGTIDWTTVNGAPSGTTVVITDGLSSAAAVDNHVYAYTSKIDRPLRMFNPRRRGADGNDVPITMISRQEYFDLPNKTNQGPPVQCYYDPQLTTGTLYAWQTPDSADDRLFFTCHIPLNDFDSSSDNPDVPVEWLDAMVWGLADRLIPAYGVPDNMANRITIRAVQLYEQVKDFNVEPVSIFFQPELEMG